MRCKPEEESIEPALSPTRGRAKKQNATKLAKHHQLVERAQRLIQKEVSFIHSTDFELQDVDQNVLDTSGLRLSCDTGRTKAPTDVPSHLAHLWQVALLTPVEEQQLFRSMNYKKYCANVLRSRLDPSKPDIQAMDRIEQCLADAQIIRNHIVQANLRLVVSIARKFVNDLTSLDELMSDGNLILMKAVDRFDYSRGFRFSTYATHSVQREFYRRYKTGRRRRVKEVSTDPDILFQSVEARDDSTELVRQNRQFHYLKDIMSSCLDAREFEIVDLRFGLQADDGGQTLREVGEKLNISKERVRQLQTRAIEHIRELAKVEIEFGDS